MIRKAAPLIAAVLVLGGTSAGLMVASGGATAGGNAQNLKFAKSDLFVEINATDGDAGLQLNLDGQPWSTLELVDPNGRVLMEVENASELKSYGLTGLTFESAEPPFDEQPISEFTARFPEGVYRFKGTTVDGRNILGQDRLTHVFPVGPVVTAPTEGAVVPSSGLVVTWQPVTKPTGVKIVHYEVIVTNADSGKHLSMELPPSATSAGIPREFLTPGTEYALEVLARGERESDHHRDRVQDELTVRRACAAHASPPAMSASVIGGRASWSCLRGAQTAAVAGARAALAA